jgi:hypothetical protein
MNLFRKPLLLFICFLLISTSAVFSLQKKNPTVSCKSAVFDALKPLPQLSYSCPTDAADEYDDRILKTPARIQALKDLMKELESFTNAAWWSSPVNDLNACYLSGKAGPLDQEQREQFNGFEYQPPIMGDSHIRLILVSDPCYQTAYGGSTAFILYRNGPRVYVTQVLDGYYSRLEKSVFLRLFSSRHGESIQITTVNISGMQPQNSYHYFDIDRRTHKAVPRKSNKSG